MWLFKFDPSQPILLYIQKMISNIFTSAFYIVDKFVDATKQLPAD